MTQKDARELFRAKLPSYVESITEKSKGKMYVCPICKSGERRNGTGAFSIGDNGTHWECFSCGKNGDIFDLIGELNGIPDYNGQFEKAAEIFGTDVGSKNIERVKMPEQQAKSADYTDFFLQAQSHITETDYPQRRGLSKAVIDRFKLGYVAEWRHPKVPNAPTSPRLIIPTGNGSYQARDTRTEIPENQKKYSKSKVGTAQIYNREALTTATKPIFIVEGEIDALSIIEVGGEAIAIGGTAGVRAVIELLKAQKPCQPLVVALDNDTAGQKASETLSESLKEIGIPFYRVNPYKDIKNNNGDECKDANEALVADRERFSQAVADIEHVQAEAEQAQREAYLKNSTANYLPDFLHGIADSVNTPCIPTGFNKLDGVLDGGLYEGLYVVGAVSSLGKTTFCLQIADQIAQAGTDVLIFSIEMARNELIAKSISRHSAQIARAQGKKLNDCAKTARDITSGKRYDSYSQEEKELINLSVQAYSEYAKHIFISEGVGDIGTKQIRETVRQHILFTGNTPVVIIDYLQILAPYSERFSDKQNTDQAVKELKQISRDHKTPVIGISSLNRASYNSRIAMESFKETGSIEYSSDVLIGLQFKGVGTESFDTNRAKSADTRNIESVILKNRNGKSGSKLEYSYYPEFNYFTEK